MLDVLTEILAAMVKEVGFDRARAYEYSDETQSFEPRAEIGGVGPTWGLFEGGMRPITVTIEDPVSYFTYKDGRMDVYKRHERRSYTTQKGEQAELEIVFNCDTDVDSAGLWHMMDIPLKGDDEMIVGKITADRKWSDTEHCGDLRAILDKDKAKLECFAHMASRAIAQARLLREQSGGWTRYVQATRTWLERYEKLVVSVLSAAAGAATLFLLQWLLT